MLDVTRWRALLRPPKTGVSGASQSSVRRPAPNTVFLLLGITRVPAGSASDAGGLQALLAADQDGVDQAVLLGLLRRHDLVPVDVLANLVDRLVRVLGEHLFQLGAHAQDLAGLDLDVRTLAVAALGGRLVDDDPRVRQRHPIAGGAGG